MANRKNARRGGRRISLSVRLSLLVLLAALVPLAAVVGVSDYFARNTLLDQGRAALSTDANAKATLIETYLSERLLDGAALASLETAIKFGMCVSMDPAPPELTCDVSLPDYKASVDRALAVGTFRDKNYTTWSLYAPNGQLLDSSSPDVLKNPPTVPDEDLQLIKKGQRFVSAVYYDPQSKHARVMIYAPIVPDPTKDATSQPVLAFLQATLQLDNVWNIVSGELGANGAGSYAFITDNNGVRIADPNKDELFSSVKPLDAATQHLIATEQRYGSDGPVPEASLPAVANSLDNTSAQDTFEGNAVVGDDTQYQFVRIHLSVVPWTYFVLSPTSTVTQVANDQVRISLMSAAVIALLAILLGLFVGRRTTVPVRNSVEELEGAAYNLKEMASRQESSASEQHWVVDACRTGLEGVRYLSNAMDQAAHRILEASNWFNDYWDRLTEDQARRTVLHLRELAAYIDEAARRQQQSSERLDKAISVTMQVSDQLVAGATAAATNAEQLELVVDDLQRVVGGRARPAIAPTPAPVAPMPQPSLPQLPQPQRQPQPAPRMNYQQGLPEPRQPSPPSRGQRGPASQWAPSGPASQWAPGGPGGPASRIYGDEYDGYPPDPRGNNGYNGYSPSNPNPNRAPWDDGTGNGNNGWR